MPDPDRILLLGESCKAYGEVTFETAADGRIACAVSVGADRSSPSLQFKADPGRYPNEDGLLVLAEGDRCLLAVADAHFGHQSSHAILSGLHARCREVPDSPDALGQLITSCAAESGPDYRSRTTLLVAVFDRAAEEGFGISFGDSTLSLVDGDAAHIATAKNHHFVTPREPASFAPEHRQSFTFRTRPGQLLCAYTDGIDECHYGSPVTSVRPRHMTELFRATAGDPRRFAEHLVGLALSGAEGHPGGQDNIALVVAAT